MSARPAPGAGLGEAVAWRPPPAALAPSENEVHLWLADLDGCDAETLVRTLAPDERRRADAFAYPRERRRFVVGRGLLRRLLARYLRANPAVVAFSYGPHGKPELAPGHRAPGLRFSCSHSGPAILYAITSGRRIGVDIEALRPLPEAAAIAELCFSLRERAALAGLRGTALERAVLRAWTLKEGYLKAVGEGLALPPERVEVAVVPHESAALQAVGGDAGEAARWSLRSLSPADGCTAALAVEGSGWRLRCWALETPDGAQAFPAIAGRLADPRPDALLNGDGQGDDAPVAGPLVAGEDRVRRRGRWR